MRHSDPEEKIAADIFQWFVYDIVHRQHREYRSDSVYNTVTVPFIPLASDEILIRRCCV